MTHVIYKSSFYKLVLYFLLIKFDKHAEVQQTLVITGFVGLPHACAFSLSI